MHLENIKAIKLFGSRHGFKVCMDTLYLGGYIGDDGSKYDWLKNRTETWEWNIHMIRETVGGYPQESYAVVVCAIQSE